MPRKASDILGFEKRGSLLQTALKRASGNMFDGAMTQTSGVNVSVRDEFSIPDMAAIGADREQRVLFEKMLKNYGRDLVKRAQRLTRQKKTIKTHLLLSSWRATVDDEGFGVRTRVTLRNDAPYAVYVHPKGDRKRLIGHYMGKRSVFMAEAKAELLASVRLLKPRLAAIIKNRALRASRKARTRKAG